MRRHTVGDSELDLPSTLSDVRGVSGARTRLMSIGSRNALSGVGGFTSDDEDKTRGRGWAARNAAYQMRED